MTNGKKRIVAVAALAIAGVTVAAFMGVGRPEGASGGSATGSDGAGLGITVAGVGKVKAAPDQASFSFGVETQGATADEALATNNEAVQAVIDAIKGQGIEEAKIQTQSVSVYPRYSDDGQIIVGYSASNTVSVLIDDLEQVGAVVDAAAKAGANQVYGPNLSIADQTELYKQALADAYDDARDKGEAVAAAAGVTLGKVVNVVEGGAAYPVAGVAEAAADGGGVPIQPGQQEIQATLTVTFAIG
ncbi:MAG: SIMPL domain-containing protein [Gaiellales bacterium]